MPRARLLPAVVLLAAAAACGGSDDPQFIDGGGVPDAGPDAREVPTGPSHTFVVSAMEVPENAASAMQLGLDIDDRPNDGVDNQLGTIFGSVGALATELDVQDSTDLSLARGDAILLVDLRGGLTGGALAVWTGEGANPSPAPCDSPSDPTCGNHLAGTGSFDLGSALAAEPIAGATVSGHFVGGGGLVVLPLVFGNHATWLTLHDAKAEIFDVNATPFVGKIGGAITLTDIHAQLLPRWAVEIRDLFAADCTVGGAPPACGCTAGTSGETLKGLFDKTPSDCIITDAEVDAVLSGFLTPDIDVDGDGSNDALSVGVGITGVAATFTPPGI